MLFFHEIVKVQYCSTRIRVEPKLVNPKLPKVKQAIIDYFKKDQMNIPLLRLVSIDLNISLESKTLLKTQNIAR